MIPDGRDILMTLIKLLEAQEQIKIECVIKDKKEVLVKRSERSSHDL